MSSLRLVHSFVNAMEDNKIAILRRISVCSRFFFVINHKHIIAVIGCIYINFTPMASASKCEEKIGDLGTEDLGSCDQNSIGMKRTSAAKRPSALREKKSRDAFETIEDSNIPVVLSGSRLKQTTSNSPSTITVIDRELIELSGARDIVEILRLVPGFQVGRYTYGDPIVTYQGQAGRYNPRVQLIIDGRPAYVPLFGGVPWSELPIAISNIDRIEVTRAPNAATYGPNSFYAVVSITTRNPNTSENDLLNIEAGGNQFYSTTFSHADRKDSLDYRLTLQAEHGEGFESIPDTERARLIDFVSNYQIDPVQRISFSVGLLEGGHVEEATFNEIYLSPYGVTTNAYAQFTWEKSENADSNLKVHFYHNHFDIEENNDYIFPADEIFHNPALEGLDLTFNFDRSSTSRRTELEVQRNDRLSKSHRVAFGGAIRLDTLQGSFLFGDDKTREIQTARLFAHSEWIPKTYLSINTGVMIEHNDLTGATASPRFSINYNHNPNNRFRLGWSHGVRSPLIFEEDGQVEYDGALSNGLQLTDVAIYNRGIIEPEKIDVFDVSYTYRSHDSSFLLEAKLDYRKVYDAIELKLDVEYDADLLDGEARYYRNDEGWSTRSFELETTYKPSEKYLLRAAYSRAFDLHVLSKDRLSPPIHTLSLLGATKFKNGITISGEYYYTSDWSWNDARQNNPSKLDRLELRIQKTMNIGKIQGKVSLQGEYELSENLDYWPRNKVSNWIFGKLEFSLP